MNQLKSSYSSLFKDSYSHPIHTCFAMIASNVTKRYSAFVPLWKSLSGNVILHTYMDAFICYECLSIRPEYSLRFYTVCVSSNKFGVVYTCLDQVHGRESACCATTRPESILRSEKQTHVSSNQFISLNMCSAKKLRVYESSI